MNLKFNSSFKDTKKHYIILDGLRGVAAVMVVLFHLLETFAMGKHSEQIINHGYLAVDFFFVLSGFVIGYAYDDRWNKMSLKEFFKRRLIRLHPMIIVGMIIGAVLFYFQDSFFFPAISETPVWKMLLVMVIGFTLFPVGRSLDIRGWTEMHPLNGPAWSLFFEYIANILYAFFLRKLPNKILAVLLFICGAALIHLAVTNGHIIGGWAIDSTQLRIGFTRLLYPFIAGLLLSRVVKVGHIKNAFFWSSLLLIVILSVPHIGSEDHVWMNGLYVALSVIFIFPLIVYIGASGEIKGKRATQLCRFLGNISYPIYIIHYPMIYTFMAWVAKNEMMSITKALPAIILVLASSILLAWASFTFYDVPVRKWLTARFMNSAQKQK
ncbi:acyltransferase family protein [Draconibacterium mangrovi]|uniref:acyltransferase family protein n=1 Tax=Draconibacterium mangrovi TaxID=2697469 RepID=UPI0013D0D0D0|nr:acyltransferase [Draconibacterium mangrovi]